MILSVLVAAAVYAQPLPEVWDPPNRPAVSMQPPTPIPPPVASQPRPNWYGAVPLAVDALALAGIAALVNADQGDYVLPLALAYGLTGPINHAVHGHGSRGVGSLALRSAVGLAGSLAFLAGRIDQCGIINLDDRPCVYKGSTLIAPLIGALALVALIDDVVWARDEGAQPVAPPRASVTLTPLVALAGNQATLSVGSHF